MLLSGAAREVASREQKAGDFRKQCVKSSALEPNNNSGSASELQDGMKAGNSMNIIFLHANGRHHN